MIKKATPKKKATAKKKTAEEMFEDRFHTRGGTLPVVRASFVK